MEDTDRWRDKRTLLKECYESRKREKINGGSFMPHQKGPITSTYTTDWFLREGEGREKLGEWMKMTSVRSQDRREEECCKQRHIASRPTHGSTKLRRKKN